jgi:signal transduction histidine kinase
LLRKLSLLLALGLGCIALAWGLFHMHAIFVDEREDALAAIATQKRALEQYAAHDLAQRLADQLKAARATLDAANRDPLLSGRSVLLIEGAEQILPRGAPPPARSDDSLEFVASLVPFRGQPDNSDTPEAERAELLLRVLEATASPLDKRNREYLETAVRALLRHRVLYVIDARRSIAITVRMLEGLAEADPDPGFMRRALRDGFDGDPRLEGVQRELLRHRARFGSAAFTELAKSIRQLSRKYRVSCDDFDVRVAEAPAPRVNLPPDIGTPMLVGGDGASGDWYVAPSGAGRVHGVAVDLAVNAREVTAHMRERGLMAESAQVHLLLTSSPLDLRDVRVSIESNEWEPAIAAANRRYQLKAALEIAIAVLVFGVIALAVVIVRRRQRFVELKSEFVSAVSHELRTPLASIRLMAETVERRTKNTPGVRDYPARIIRDIDALSFLVENILSYGRLSRGRWTPSLCEVRLGDVAAELDAERDAWAKKPAELECELEDVVLRADRELVKLVLTNLLRNACQYCQRDPVRIHLTAAREVKRWRVLVRDNGVGVRPEERERIFEDFHRGDRTNERGSGLGLSICRKIMEAHGGTIRVADSSDEGTAFELSFPDARS